MHAAKAALIFLVLITASAVAEEAEKTKRPQVSSGVIVVRSQPNRFTLIRHGDRALAVKLTERVPPKGGWRGDGVRYEWYQAEAGTTDFTNDKVKKGGGVVYDYALNRPKIPVGMHMVNVNLDPPRTRKVGGLTLSWHQGDWITLSTSKHMRQNYSPAMAATECTELAALRWDAADLHWVTPKAP